MNTYNIGPLTMEYVFKRTGLENVSDLQAVFDAMERALEYKNECYRDMHLEMMKLIAEAGYEDRA